jgi:hypothetical protein
VTNATVHLYLESSYVVKNGQLIDSLFPRAGGLSWHPRTSMHPIGQKEHYIRHLGHECIALETKQIDEITTE